MEQNMDIISFSRDLCVVNSDETFRNEGSEAYEFVNNVSELLDDFRDAYCTKFHSLYRNKMMEFSETEEQFLNYTIPRCMKLVDDDHFYFSFMLVAAFIQELVFYIREERDCHRFGSTAYKCLVAVFKRKFEDKFEDEGGWEGLRTYCENTDNMLREKKYKLYADNLSGGDKHLKKHVYDLIKQCDIKSDERFVLNEYELSLVTIDRELRLEAEAYCACSSTDTMSVQDESTLQVDRESEDDEDSGIGTATQSDLEDEPEFNYWEMRACFRSTSSSDSEPELYSSESEYENDSGNESPFYVFHDEERSREEIDKSLRRSFPKKYGTTLTERMCGWCKKTCYEYGKYFFERHVESLMNAEEEVEEGKPQCLMVF